MAGAEQHALFLPPENSPVGRKRASTNAGTKLESGLDGVASFFSALLGDDISKPRTIERKVWMGLVLSMANLTVGSHALSSPG